MEKVILYDLDAVDAKLKGFRNFINNSSGLELVAVWPIGDGKIRLLTKGLIAEHTQLKHGFNRSREFIKSLMPECDYYYQIKPTKDNLELRKTLVNNRISINIDENGVGYIEGKVNDDTLVYNISDIEPKKSQIPAEKISYFYEYDPLYENPSFGENYELIKVDEDANHTPIWKKMPKIIQNEHSTSYAERALEKGVRTVVEISDEEYDEVLREIMRHGEQSKLKEFSTVPGMDDDFIIERSALQINNEIGKSL